MNSVQHKEDEQKYIIPSDVFYPALLCSPLCSVYNTDGFWYTFTWQVDTPQQPFV